MDQFELPANIKQIGSIGDGLRIYVEDYVCSYLQSYAEAGGYQERIALLVGRYLVIDNQPVLFVNGAVQGKYTEVRNGLTLFTDRSWDYAQSCIDQYFPGMKIVGWMQSQPSYGVYLNSGYIDVHAAHFKKKYQVMFVMDPIEKTNAFYVYTKSGMTLEEAKGYFIYYDKNESMHEYMLHNKMTDEDLESTGVGASEAGEAAEKPPAVESLRSRPVNRAYPKDSQDQKRVLNLLVGLSAVLFIVSFIMGAGLIQNQDRLNTLENQVASLKTSYKNSTLQSAFADENDGTINTADNATEEAVSTGKDSSVESSGGDKIQASAGQSTAANSVTPSAAATALPQRYTVQDGDTLNSISVKFYGSTGRVQDIMTLNNLTDPNHIISGITINLPEK
jgi:LysM repeat protein